MDWGRLFFGFSGRVNRRKYWLAWIVLIAILATFWLTSYLTESIVFQSLSGMITIVIFISIVAVGIKRLQDRNKNGWYVTLFYIAPVVLFVGGMKIGVSHDSSNMVATVLWLIAFAITIWAFVELGCLRGTIGGNSYGADPLAPEVLTPPVRTQH